DNRQIKFRVSDHEYEELEQTANNFHMSVPAFAKKRALGYRMKPPKVDKSGAIEIAKQLRAIGNNVNQLTKRANASNGKIDSEELQAIKKELQDMATIQLGTTGSASQLCNYAEKRAIEKDGYNLDIDYAKSQMKQTRELFSKND